jgi:hypothetical protein
VGGTTVNWAMQISRSPAALMTTARWQRHAAGAAGRWQNVRIKQISLVPDMAPGDASATWERMTYNTKVAGRQMAIQTSQEMPSMPPSVHDYTPNCLAAVFLF